MNLYDLYDYISGHNYYLLQAQQAIRRSSEMKNNENYLSSRVDDLESSERNLKLECDQTKQLLTQKERKVRLRWCNFVDNFVIFS